MNKEQETFRINVFEDNKRNFLNRNIQIKVGSCKTKKKANDDPGGDKRLTTA